MLYTKIQPWIFLDSGEKRFLTVRISRILAWRPSWLMDHDHLYKCSTPFNRRLHVKFKENWLRGFRGGRSKVWTDNGRPFVQMFNPPLTEGSTWSLKKTGSGVSEEVVQRCGRTTDDGQWTDRRRMASYHNSSSRAFGSGELKIVNQNVYHFTGKSNHWECCWRRLPESI